MRIVAYFAERGLPKKDLSPTLKITDLSDDSLAVDDGAMAESGNGYYKYNFGAYDSSKDYTILCDSVTLSGTERYAMGITEDFPVIKEKIDNVPAAVFDTPTDTHKSAGSFGRFIQKLLKRSDFLGLLR